MRSGQAHQDSIFDAAHIAVLARLNVDGNALKAARHGLVEVPLALAGVVNPRDWVEPWPRVSRAALEHVRHHHRIGAIFQTWVSVVLRLRRKLPPQSSGAALRHACFACVAGLGESDPAITRRSSLTVGQRWDACKPTVWQRAPVLRLDKAVEPLVVHRPARAVWVVEADEVAPRAVSGGEAQLTLARVEVEVARSRIDVHPALRRVLGPAS
eukprot:CAMPEP_0183373642 /NCGR_PEP_ID=MMETSP0164_2-20130417/112042_1 /TAXON_ID=221442 /ORGANISM="Coccolithus pelagicus ssp braarudi, Strain PLY182g" /LENGTH=211 /DNA_ID=CAMNT_0025550559 /DNA_START=178 /DNA_END=811 /DNA_ORIENTATION=-